MPRKNPREGDRRFARRGGDAPADRRQRSKALHAWEEFLKLMPADVEVPPPLWATEFGATYPFEETTPIDVGPANSRPSAVRLDSISRKPPNVSASEICRATQLIPEAAFQSGSATLSGSPAEFSEVRSAVHSVQRPPSGRNQHPQPLCRAGGEPGCVRHPVRTGHRRAPRLRLTRATLRPDPEF